MDRERETRRGRRSTGGTLALLALSLLFLLGGGWGSARAWEDVQRGLASAEWPSARGEIVESRLRKGRKGPRKRLTLRYRYAAAGFQEHGSRIGFFHGLWGPSSPRRDVRRYPVGQEVEVRFSPDDPSQAVLEPGVWWVGYAVSQALCCALLGLGGLGLRSVVRGRRAP